MKVLESSRDSLPVAEYARIYLDVTSKDLTRSGQNNIASPSCTDPGSGSPLILVAQLYCWRPLSGHWGSMRACPLILYLGKWLLRRNDCIRGKCHRFSWFILTYFLWHKCRGLWATESYFHSENLTYAKICPKLLNQDDNSQCLRGFFPSISMVQDLQISYNLVAKGTNSERIKLQK